jgi:dCMP deaminase
VTTDERPTMDMTLLATAFVMARRGTCLRAQVGCVIALDGRILSTGYNGAPRGMPHCEHLDGLRSAERPPDAEPCTTSVHAEANAVAFAARYGVSLDAAVLYTTLSPCVTCAQLIVNSGIQRVVCGAVYRNTGGVELLLHAGVAVDVLSDRSSVTHALTIDEMQDVEP